MNDKPGKGLCGVKPCKLNKQKQICTDTVNKSDSVSIAISCTAFK